MPQGESRAARRPAIPVISVTGRSARSIFLGLAVDHRQRPVRLGRVGDQLGQRPRPGDAHRHRHAQPLPDRVADRLRQRLVGLPPHRLRREEELVDRVILHPRRPFAHDLQHQPAQDLVPAEIPLDVDPPRALHQRVPDRHPGRDPRRLHLVALGDHARPLIAQHPDRLARSGTRREPAPPTRRSSRRRDDPPPSSSFASAWTEVYSVRTNRSRKPAACREVRGNPGRFARFFRDEAAGGRNRPGGVSRRIHEGATWPIMPAGLGRLPESRSAVGFESARPRRPEVLDCDVLGSIQNETFSNVVV